MATLPKRVQDQLAAADALLAQQNQPQETPPAPTESPAPEPQPAPTPVETPTPEATPPAPAPTPEAVNWEHKFKTLQGLFNAEVPKLQRQVRELTEHVSKIETAKPAPAPAPEEVKPVVDPKDADAFGADLVEMVQRVTTSVVGAMGKRVETVIADFDKRISSLETALKGTAQTVAMTAEELFFSNIAKVVPDWQAVNADEAFLAWLAEVDPVYGQPRQAALDSAQANLDAARAIAVFQAFKATLAPAPTPPGKAKPSALDKQVSPSAVASAPPAPPAGKPTYTQAQVSAFYRDVQRGAYRGQEAEVARIEALINEAIAEGRVM